jgi:hypothetical protein
MMQLPGRGIVLSNLLIVCLLTAAGCTTHSFYREDGVKVTVKKFAGVPYLEKEERTKVVTPGSGNQPAE